MNLESEIASLLETGEPHWQTLLLYVALNLDCDMPILEALFHHKVRQLYWTGRERNAFTHGIACWLYQTLRRELARTKWNCRINGDIISFSSDHWWIEFSNWAWSDALFECNVRQFQPEMNLHARIIADGTNRLFLCVDAEPPIAIHASTLSQWILAFLHRVPSILFT